MSESKERCQVSEIFQKLMEENPNIDEVKKMVKNITDISEKHIYHAMIGSQEEYLQVYGLTYHEEEQFNYINQLLHQRTTQILDRIAENKLEVKSTLPLPPPPPPKIPNQIVEEVQEVLRNIDLPLSLFKRNDNYWSHDNPKTIQVKEYIKQLHEQDKKWKGQLKKKRQQILNEKNQLYHKTIEEQTKQEQKIKEEEKIRMIKKIEFIKSQSNVRKRTIDEGLDMLKKQGRPLYKKMEQDFYNKVELPTLQEKKRKLSEVRELRKSVDLNEIQQHKQKYQKIKQEHEEVRILNNPVKVSYKSQFYKSLEKSSVREIDQSQLKSLYDKRLEYAQMVKQNFKPAIDQEKTNEVASRIEEMNKRFKRAKRKRREVKEEGDQEEDDEEDEEPEPEPEPQPEEEDEEDQDQDDQFKVHKPKDDQYEPTHQERYQMGLKFLQQARKKRKKIQVKKKEGGQSGQADIKNKTFSAKQAQQDKLSQDYYNINTIIDAPPTENNKKIVYRNYLHEMSKTNKTIDFIDTSRLKNELTEDMKVRQRTKVQQLQNNIRNVEVKAKNEQQLLKYRKVKKNDAITKKLQLDNAIIDTIKARLALMNN